MFKSSIELPDSGLQERDHDDLEEMKRYLVSCLRMDAYPESMKVTAKGVNITNLISKELTSYLLRESGGRQ